MKQVCYFLFTAMLMGGCDHSHDTKVPAPASQEFYGDKFDPQGAIPQSELLSKITGNDTIPAKFEAKIVETCAKAGCWMTVENPGGYPMYVYMKDHAFGVPLSGAANLKCVVNGVAYRDTLSVKLLQHFAEDAKKSQAEIDAITEPLPAIAVTATGVMIEGVAKAEEAGHEHKEGDGHNHGTENH